MLSVLIDYSAINTAVINYDRGRRDHSGNIVRNTEAVSYTHLDVYKRQQ